MAEPWEVPTTKEGRDHVIKLLEEYRRSGKEREAGLCLAELSHLYKHVGSHPGSVAFEEAAKSGAEAVAILRRTGSKSELCRALRLAAVPLVADCEPMLEESLSLAREIGDIEQEAWTTFRMRGIPMNEKLVERALQLFEQCRNLEGQASCYVVLGFRPDKHDVEKLEKAIRLYEEAGNEIEANRTRQILLLAQRTPDGS